MSVRDVVIVGGGPAGSACAIMLARAGIDVEIIERRQFPRAKPCGDCVSPGANALLQRLGVWEAVLATRPARLRGWSLSTAGGAAFTADFGDDAFSLGIARETLDAILLDAARAAGAAVRENTCVTDLARNDAGAVIGITAVCAGETQRIAARLTVGADGLRSRVARKLAAHRRLPRLRKLSLTARVRGVPGVVATGEMHVRRGACLGVAPVENTADPMCNVTVVLTGSGSETGSGSGSGSGKRDLMRAALAGFASRNLSHLIEDDTFILTSGPFDWPTRRIVFAGAALVGDAAGYYDPFTGQGIYQALAGAELLAEHILTDSLGTYERRHRALLAPARRVQGGVEFVCSRPRLAQVAFGALGAAPTLAQRLIEVTGDMRPVRSLLKA